MGLVVEIKSRQCIQGLVSPCISLSRGKSFADLRSNLSRRSNRGVALLLCLLVVVLLFGFVVTLATWLSAEYRIVRGSKNRISAENNALLAMDLALAQLQAAAGPDRRVTATAGIVKNASGQFITGPNAQWTGVWDAASGVRVPGKAPDYSAKSSGPLAWMVSGSVTPANYAPTRAPNGMPVSEDDVLLVGAGTLGTAAASKGETVLVPRQAIAEATRTGQTATTGHYAYWIGDEGVKARVNLANFQTDEGGTSWDAIFRQSMSAQNGIGFTAFFQPLSQWPSLASDARVMQLASSAEDLSNLASVSSSTPMLQAAHASFHDLGYWSRGLLTDARFGGTRLDLSRVFELPNVGDPLFNFAPDTIFTTNPRGETCPYKVPALNHVPIGYLFEEPVESPIDLRNRVRGPTWHQLRNAYRQYAREAELGASSWAPSGDAWRARGAFPNNYDFFGSFNGPAEGNSGYVKITSGGVYIKDPWAYPFQTQSSFASTPVLPVLDPNLAPVLTRVCLAFSLQRIADANGNKVASLVLDVVGTLFNPYDVPIEFDGFKVALGFDTTSPSATKYWSFKINDTVTTLGDLLKNNYPSDSTAWETSGARNMFHFVLTGDGKASHAFPVRLMPGEVIALSAAGDAPADLQILPAKRGWNRMGGILLKKILNSGTSFGSLLVADNESLKIAFQSRVSDRSTAKVSTSIPAPGKIDIALTEASGLKSDRIVQEITYTPGHNIYPNAYFANRVFQGPELDDKRPVGYIDIQLKAGDATLPASIVGANNVRASVHVPLGNVLALGNSKNIGSSPSYTWELKELSSIEDINVPISSSGNSRWGTSHTLAGEPQICLWEVPRAPWINLTSLQNADIGVSSVHQGNAIGNSFPSPYVPLNKTTHYNVTRFGFGNNDIGMTASDSCYLANEAIWDRFFFSSLVPRSDKNMSVNDVAGAFLPSNGGKTLPNPRVVLAQGNAFEPDVADLLDFEKNAGKLATEGAFNVNSVSKEAWKAVLAGLSGFKPVERNADGSIDTSAGPVSGAYFSRFRLPAKSGAMNWTGGYRELTPAQIDDLAEGIVNEVKKRGPFLSLGEFVNRRLENGPLGMLGAIQAALDSMELNSSVINGAASPAALPCYPNQQGVPPSVYTGIPGFLTQADILSSIGPCLSPRSDTFRIRAYGDAANARSGQTEARAWCEAIVQRLPEFVDPANTASDPVTVDDGSGARVTSPTLSKLNEALGRRFQIISFRWLREDEV